MTIPDDIIKKFGLVDNHETTGHSFDHNCRIFRVDKEGFEGLRFMECNLDGRPSWDVNFIDLNKRRSGSMTVEIMRDLEWEQLIKLMY